jgi:hypothetical protein
MAITGSAHNFNINCQINNYCLIAMAVKYIKLSISK